MEVMIRKATLLKSIGCVIFTLLAATLSMAQSYDHTEYLTNPSGAKKGEYVKGTLDFNASTKQITFLGKGGTPLLTVSFAQIKRLVYERTSHPRYVQGVLIAWPLMLTKAKKHYLTIQYEDAPNSGHYALIHLDKGNYQQLLATAEAVTGKTVERSEER